MVLAVTSPNVACVYESLPPRKDNVHFLIFFGDVQHSIPFLRIACASHTVSLEPASQGIARSLSPFPFPFPFPLPSIALSSHSLIHSLYALYAIPYLPRELSPKSHMHRPTIQKAFPPSSISLFILGLMWRCPFPPTSNHEAPQPTGSPRSCSCSQRNEKKRERNDLPYQEPVPRSRLLDALSRTCSHSSLSMQIRSLHFICITTKRLSLSLSLIAGL